MFAVFAPDVGDGSSTQGCNEYVGVYELSLETFGHVHPNGGLARAHHADQPEDHVSELALTLRVALGGGLKVCNGVASKAAERLVGQHVGDHLFTYDAGPGDGTGVGALEKGLG